MQNVSFQSLPYHTPTRELRKHPLQLLLPSTRVLLRELVGKNDVDADPVSEVDAQEDGDPDVRGEEGLHGPALPQEDVKAVYQGQEEEEDEGRVGPVRLHPRPVGDLLGVRDTLHITRFAEPETLALSDATLRYARPLKSAVNPTAMYGTPCFVHLAKILGALPATAREYREREDMYKKEFPEDHAEVMTMAF
ncbi:uncharacterized protein L3040_003402 [Drepanopeziza brunnea f. sp. 'multigermtubi']|uniref:uncharacterized protein n=1 Tax=Drepanopeziza brunnea f. sp. 'multigermtubi' TaxID=698441 RepID=UPI0023A523B3|nr:hypothetical protein L3040_003402 [Drepanopeziza brunnea f. sp. 'multigermtubi']